ncbi:hypothetical protein HYX08_00665 [Candidatus Woesearchaeota archaeon]|nr:hypothetical protein [Candidatus Woesearchaeota archaeon]
MGDVKFLEKDDIVQIEPRLKSMLQTTAVTLERGYVLQEGSEGFYFLIVRDAKHRRYKVDAFGKVSDQNGRVFPSAVEKAYDYERSFAGKKERELFDQLAEGYANGKIEPEQFFQSVRTVSVSEEELIEEVKKKYDKITGLGAAVLGFIAAAALYKVSEYTSVDMRNYADFWAFSLGTGWLTGLIRSTIPAAKIDINVMRKRKQMVGELTDIIRGERPKTT